MDNENLNEQSKQNEQSKKTKQKPKSIIKEILSWVILVAVAISIAYLINTTIIVNASVPTGSMRPTINEGTRLVAWRLAYAFSEPQRLDVVVFRSPDNTGVLYVKRVIGVPGERIEIVDGKVYVGGYMGEGSRPLDEWYLAEPPRGPSLMNQSFEVPAGSYFVMGDNRNDSKDSRGLGFDSWQNLFMPIENILGRASFSYFPRIGLIR
jgi:signal peptidase I